MPLRPISFYLPSSSEVTILFSKSVGLLTKNNFKITASLDNTSSLEVISIKIEDKAVTLKTSPQNPRTYYTLDLVGNETYEFKSLDGEALINDKASRKIFFVGTDEFNPVKDRMFSNLSKIFNLEGTSIEDILSVHAKEIHNAQRSVGELLADNYLRVSIDDEIRTRTGGSYDIFANENVFKLKRVSKNITGVGSKGKIINYQTSIEPRHTLVDNIISLQEGIETHSLSISKDNIFGSSIIISLPKKIIKLLELKVVKPSETQDCDGEIGTVYNLEKYKYLIKDNKYDDLANIYLPLNDKQIIIPPDSNIFFEKNDSVSIKYLTKNVEELPTSEISAYEVVSGFTETTPSFSKHFKLSNSNIVTASNAVPKVNGVRFYTDESLSEIPEEFKSEIKYDVRLPKNPGEYSVNYATGEVNVFGLEGTGTSERTYVARYNYRRDLEENFDFFVEGQDFALNSKRKILNDKIYISFDYETVFVEGTHYRDNTHIEKINESVKASTVSGFSLRTESGQISEVFRILNRTTGEIYNPIYYFQNKVVFSGNKSPEFREVYNENPNFESVYRESLIETFTTVSPAFGANIKAAIGTSNIPINPPIHSRLIDKDTVYYLKSRDGSSEYKINFFSGGEYYNSIGIEGSQVPQSGVGYFIGPKMAIFALENQEVLNLQKESIGSMFSSSVTFSEKGIFKTEKYFDLEQSRIFLDSENIFLLNSFSSDNILLNLSRIKKSGDYGIDYTNGVIYLGLNEGSGFGSCSYNFNKNNTNFSNLASVNDLKKENTKTKNSYKFDSKNIDDGSFSVANLNASYESNTGVKASYKNEEKETCIILDDYTIVVSKDIQKLNKVLTADQVLGKNANGTSGYIEESNSKNINDKNLLNKLNYYVDENRIDLKSKEVSSFEKNINFELILNKATSNIYSVVRVSDERQILDQNLNHVKSEIFFSNISNGTTTFVLSVINEDLFDFIDSLDFVKDESGNVYNIISYSKISKTIELQGSSSSSNFYLVTTASFSGDKLVLNGKSDLSSGDKCEIIYVAQNTPQIGTAVFVEYSFGILTFDYLFLKDDISISYEYGDNSIFWLDRGAVSEGESYYVSYEYGALRTALANNFAKLVQLPYFSNFGLDKAREPFRDALEGALQSFSEGPTIPSIKRLVSAISKTEPDIFERNLPGWVLGKHHLSTDLNYSGNLEYSVVRYKDGLLFDDKTTLDIPAQSNIQLREGSISTWIKNNWNGISNDANLAVEIFGFGKESYYYSENKKFNSLENKFFELSFLKYSGIVDDSKVLRISNYKDESNGYFGICKSIRNITPMDNLDVAFNSVFDIKRYSSIWNSSGKSVGTTLFNDGVRTFSLDFKIKKIKDLFGTVTLPPVNSFEIEKKYLQTIVSGDEKEFFDIFDKPINIKLTTPINKSAFSSLTASSFSSKNIFVADSNNYIYRVKSFLDGSFESEMVNDDITEINIDRIPINYDKEINYDNISTFSPGPDISLFCVCGDLETQKTESSQLQNYNKNIIMNFDSNNFCQFVKILDDNKVDVTVNDVKTEIFYSDCYLTDDISLLHPSYFSSDDITELKKKKGLQFLIRENSKTINYFISKNISIKTDRFLSKNNIYIGSKGVNPRSTKFDLTNKIDGIEGIYASEKDGVYIGITDSFVEEGGLLTKHWQVSVKLNKNFLIPENVTNINGALITNYKYYSVDVFVEGEIEADGDFSLVTEV